MQVLVGRTRCNAVQVLGDRTRVAGDRPLVVVKDNNESARRLRDIVESLVTDPAGEGRIAGHRNDMLPRAVHVACRCHAESS